MTTVSQTAPAPQPSLPAAIARDAFEQAVALSAATMECAPYNTPLQKLADAARLVRDNLVHPFHDGTWTVRSLSDPQVTYEICDSCPCPQGQKNTRSKWCKHLTAIELWKRVQMRLHPTPTSNGHVAPKTETPVMTTSGEPLTPVPLPTALTLAGHCMTEAPYSCNCRVRTVTGFEFQLTIRKQTAREFLEALTNLPAWLEEQGFIPADHAPTRVPTPPPTPEAATCRYHGAENMKPSKFGEGQYVCSMKLSDGSWCNQKWPRKGDTT